MAFTETIKTGRKYRKCVDNTSGNKVFERYSFWGKASDIEFNDGTTAESKVGSFKGVTTNENQVAGYAADVTLVKSIKTSLSNLITSLTNLVNSINTRLGGFTFYEDSTGKYVVGADSVPKKLGSVPDVITQSESSLYTTESIEYDRNGDWWKVRYNYIFDIASVSANYASLTAEDFYFCILKCQISHYFKTDNDANDPNPFTLEKVYNPTTGQLRINNVAGGSYRDPSSDTRLAFSITEFKLLIM